METSFSICFLALLVVTLGLFLAGERPNANRRLLCGIAALGEGVIFIMLSYVFYHISWGSIPAWLMSLWPLAGAVFAFRMAYRRFARLEL